MIASAFDHIKISGIAGAVPTRKVLSTDYYTIFGENTVNKLIASTGVKECYHTHEKQTLSDLTFSAAEHLLETMHIDCSSIGVLLLVLSYPDYFCPSTSMVLQKRLALSQDCIVYDMNFGCSGFIYGMQTAASLLQCSNAKRALVLVGDTASKTISPLDTTRILFGDAGTAVLLDKTEEETAPVCFGLKSDGNRFKAIIIPAGGFRNPEASRELTLWGDGNRRSDYNLYMNGMDVFNFTMTDVPALFKEFIGEYAIDPNDVDALVLHQANTFILKHLAKKIKISMDKVPLSLDRYGNTGAASVPITICDHYGGQPAKKVRLMASGFGIGLSWGVATFELDTGVVLPIIHTDDYYTDGAVSHE